MSPAAAGFVTLIAAVAALLGWYLDEPLLRSVIPGAVEMKANTAVCLLLDAISLIILGVGDSRQRGLANALTIIAGSIGLLTLVEYGAHLDFGIDEALFEDKGTAYNFYRGRMSPYAAIAFVSLAFGISAAPIRRFRIAAGVACSVVVGIGAVSLLGYAWNARELVTDRLVPPVALNTAIVLLLLGIGAFAAGALGGFLPTARRRSAFSVEVKILFSLCSALVLLFVGGGYLYRSTAEFDAAMTKVAAIQEVRASLARLYGSFSDAESAQRDYLISGESRYRDAYLGLKMEVGKEQERAADLLAADLPQRDDLALLLRSVQEWFGIFDDAMARFDRKEFQQLRDLTRDGTAEPTRAGIRTLVQRIDAAQSASQKNLEEGATRIRQVTLVALVVTLTIATAFGVLLIRTVRAEMRVREEGRKFDARGQRALTLFSSTLDPGHAIDGAVELLGELHSSAAVAFYHPKPDGSAFERGAYVGSAAMLAPTLDAAAGPVADAAKSGRAVLEPEVHEDAGGFLNTGGSRSSYLMACPASYLGRLQGVLVMVTPKALRTHERAFVRRMAGQLSVTLSNLDQYRDLKDLSTELQTKNDALQRQAAELERGNRMKSEFLATMSHELRTPLNAIIGFSEVLQDNLAGELSEQQREYVGDILGSGTHLLALINDILDLSKVEAGKMELDRELIDIRPLLTNALTMVRERAHSHRIILSSNIEELIPPVFVDARRMKQIVFNLLSNAVKFTPDGGKVELSAGYSKDATGEYLTVQVTDTGIGISPEDQEKLFRPFVQIDSSLAKHFEGTGLGLALVKRLTALHGGEIAIKSETGKGASFTARIPYSGAKGTDDAAHVVHGDANNPRPLALVVEDDDRAAELLRVRLERLGLSVLRASTSAEALRLARDVKPALITLDVLLPDADGWDVLQELKADAATASIPVIVVSIVADMKRGISLGATSVLQKPVDLAALTSILAALSLLPIPQTTPVKVMLVDDDPASLKTMQLHLDAAGCQVVSLSDGSQVVERADQVKPDVVILDLIMPQRSGFEVVDALKADIRTSGIPIIIVTAKTLTREDRETLAGHVTNVFQKGELSHDQLLGEVRRATWGMRSAHGAYTAR